MPACSLRLGDISAWVMEYSQVERQYGHEDLQRLATDAAFCPDGWTVAEAAAFRLLDQCARAARLDTDLRNTRALRIAPHPCGDPDRACATLSTARVLDLTFRGTDGHGAVSVNLMTDQRD